MRERPDAKKFLPSRQGPDGNVTTLQARWGEEGRECFLLSKDPQVDPALGSAGLEASEALWKPRSGPFFNWCYSLAVLLSWLAEPQHRTGCLCSGWDVGPWAHTALCGYALGGASWGASAPPELTSPLPRSCPGRGHRTAGRQPSLPVRIWNPGRKMRLRGRRDPQ